MEPCTRPRGHRPAHAGRSQTLPSRPPPIAAPQSTLAPVTRTRRRCATEGVAMHRFGVPRSTLPALAAAALMATAVLGLAAILAPPAVAAPFTSPDGLWTWSRPLPHGYPASSISAPAPGVLFVATTTSDALATSDGGASWTWSRTGGVAGFTGAEGVQFVSTSDGWAWGADATGKNGVVLRTTDGGATWQSSLTIPVLPSLSVSFADPSTGWLLAGEDFSEFYGYDVLSSTTDGGQTWSVPVALPQDTGLAAFTAP